MKKTIFIFSTLIIAILVLFQVSKYSVIRGDFPLEITLAVIAIVFFFIGIYINRRNKKAENSVPVTLTNKKEYEINHTQIATLGLSKREYEVLCQLADGHSNKEIASILFISENTIKTHVSSIYTKLNVKRRTQAIQKAKALQIL